MKKNTLPSLLGLAAVLILAGVWMWNLSLPALLQNDSTEICESDGIFSIPDSEIPLVELPENPDEDESTEQSEDLYEGLDETQIEYVKEILALVNEERAKAGLPGLEPDTALRQAAQTRAAECVRKFSHTRPDGTSYKTAISDAGLELGYTGENVATGYTSAQHVMQGWMRSSGHRANILNKNYTKIGIGLVENTGNRYGGYSWAQLFIK